MKYKLETDKRVFITSDTHYGHKNLCRGVSAWDANRSQDSVRDFDTLDEMNDQIVHKINAVVGEDDYLIHLGDWSFGGFENIKKFRDRIVCKNILLVLGNHDHHIENNREGTQDNFLKVFDGILDLEVRVRSSPMKQPKYI